jgi:type III pantothenate kinase
MEALNLLVYGDVGNSYSKFWITDGKFRSFQRVETEKLKDFLSSNASSFKKSKALIASVVPAVNSILENSFKECLFVTSEDLPVKSRYEGVLGADRIVNICAGLNFFDSFMVVSLGTGFVIDVVVDREFLGGIILPGLETSIKCLEEKTAMVKKISPSITFELGKNTAECVSAGVCLGILSVISYLRKLYKVPVILTGGWAEKFKSFINPEVCDEHLPFLGLKDIARRRGVENVGLERGKV